MRAEDISDKCKIELSSAGVNSQFEMISHSIAVKIWMKCAIHNAAAVHGIS